MYMFLWSYPVIGNTVCSLTSIIDEFVSKIEIDDVKNFGVFLSDGLKGLFWICLNEFFYNHISEGCSSNNMY